MGMPQREDDPNLHRYLITVQAPPAPGVFKWHYVQCVLRFATEEYRSMDNIAHFVFPLIPCKRDEPGTSENNSLSSNLFDIVLLNHTPGGWFGLVEIRMILSLISTNAGKFA